MACPQNGTGVLKGLIREFFVAMQDMGISLISSLCFVGSFGAAKRGLLNRLPLRGAHTRVNPTTPASLPACSLSGITTYIPFFRWLQTHVSQDADATRIDSRLLIRGNNSSATKPPTEACHVRERGNTFWRKIFLTDRVPHPPLER